MKTKSAFHLGLRWLGITIITLLGVLSIVGSVGDGDGDGDGNGNGGDGEIPKPLATVPDVVGQFLSLQHHGDGLAFRLGEGSDPGNWTSGNPCKHYQSLTRVDISRTPYIFLVRSGNHTDGCKGQSDNPGELLVVEMGSREAAGERLRSNRLQPDQRMDDSLPPKNDIGIKSIIFSGKNNWPSAMHPAGIQAIDDVLVIIVDTYCDVGWNKYHEDHEYFDYGDAAWDCIDPWDTVTNGILLVDISNPMDPRLLREINTYVTDSLLRGLPKADAIAVTKDPVTGKYLFATKTGNDLWFYEPTTMDLADSSLQLVLIDKWSPDELPAIDQSKWMGWQTLSFVRQSDGALYLIGGDNTDTWEPIRVGEDWARLFKVTHTGVGPQTEFSLSYIAEKPLFTEHPQMGNFKAAGGVYVSPAGELIIYTGHHDSFEENEDGEDVKYVAMGEFRHIDVTHNGLLEFVDVDHDGRFEDSCSGWVELYENVNGWDDVYNNRMHSLMFDYRDRHLDDWRYLEDYNSWEVNLIYYGFNDETSAARWHLPEGQKAWLYEHIDYVGQRIELAEKGFIVNMEDIDWNDKISSVRFSPVADLGGPYQGAVNTPIVMDSANPCYENDATVAFDWSTNSTACVISGFSTRRPEIWCSESGTHGIKLKITDTVTGEFVEKEGVVTIN